MRTLRRRQGYSPRFDPALDATIHPSRRFLSRLDTIDFAARVAPRMTTRRRVLISPFEQRSQATRSRSVSARFPA